MAVQDEAVTAWRQNEAALAKRGDDVGARCARLRLAEARAQGGHTDDLNAALRAVRAGLPAIAEGGAVALGVGWTLHAGRALRLHPRRAASAAVQDTRKA